MNNINHFAAQIWDNDKLLEDGYENAKTGNVNYTIMIQDIFESTKCIIIEYYWPALIKILETTNVESIKNNINNILNETLNNTETNIERIDSIINVAKGLL